MNTKSPGGSLALLKRPSARWKTFRCVLPVDRQASEISKCSKAAKPMVTDARRGKSLFYFLSSTKLFDCRLVERARMISCYRERALHPISSMIQAICTYVGLWFSILFAATRFLEVFFVARLLPAFIFHENEISRVKEKSKCEEFVHGSMIFIYLRGDTFLERFRKFAIAKLLPASLFPMETRFPDRQSLRSIAREPKWNAKDKGSLETRRDV